MDTIFNRIRFCRLVEAAERKAMVEISEYLEVEDIMGYPLTRFTKGVLQGVILWPRGIIDIVVSGESRRYRSTSLLRIIEFPSGRVLFSQKHV
jgi:hypothetical protein